MDERRRRQRAAAGGRCHKAAITLWTVLLLLTCLPQPASSMRVRYCPNGGYPELGLCYQRCPLGWIAMGCSCWQAARVRSRGCGSIPATCDARSFTAQQLAPLASKGEPFTLVLTADPQLFRFQASYNTPRLAASVNRGLAESIRRVGELRQWPRRVGGGGVQAPRSLVVLGDLTETHEPTQQDAFRHFYDPAYPGNTDDLVNLPTWLMLGPWNAGSLLHRNHDMVNNQGRCWARSLSRNGCARLAVDLMRSAISPACPTKHWTGFPKSNVTSFDVHSMAYSFDYGAYHFVMLQHNPRFSSSHLGIRQSMRWLASELARAGGAGRSIVLAVHAHEELHLTSDAAFAGLLNAHPVVALFYGHIHIPPWGFTGTFPNTSVPVFNCGASWYRVYCLAEFAEGRLRVGVARHAANNTRPRWVNASLHLPPSALLPSTPLAQGDGDDNGAGGLLPARSLLASSGWMRGAGWDAAGGPGTGGGARTLTQVHSSGLRTLGAATNAADAQAQADRTSLVSVLVHEVLPALLGAALLLRL